MEGEVRQQQMGVTEQEQVLRVKGRTVELLPDAENNMAKLQVTKGGGEVMEELDRKGKTALGNTDNQEWKIQ